MEMSWFDKMMAITVGTCLLAGMCYCFGLKGGLFILVVVLGWVLGSTLAILLSILGGAKTTQVGAKAAKAAATKVKVKLDERTHQRRRKS